MSCISAQIQVQDSSYYYVGWGKPGTAAFVARDSLKDFDYTQVDFLNNKPVMIKHFSRDSILQDHVENEYDQYGNHISSKSFNAFNKGREEFIFRNDPTEMALFRTVFGPTFSPANSNFMIRREYNEYGRETAYYIIGAHGKNLCSRITIYRDDKRKEQEILRDELNDTLLTERRYKYVDSEKRTILEEFNGAGKMVQRVVLFDHHDIIQE